MGESAVWRFGFFTLGFGVFARVFPDASRFLRVSRFSLRSRSRGGMLGRERAVASLLGFGFNGDDTAGMWSSSSGRRSGGAIEGVFERDGGCGSAIAGDVDLLQDC